MTGDWGGARDQLQSHGVTFDLDSTHYYQALLAGTGDHAFEYGGRLDAYLNGDTDKLGLWSGGLIRTHAEYFYGSLNPTLGGVVAPTNLGVRLPNGGPDNVEVTSIQLVQKIGGRMSLIAGKINTVDLIAGDPLFGGVGVSRFLNLAFAAPPNGLLPPVIMRGILSVNTAPYAWTFMVFDPEDRTADYFPDDLFHTGVNASASVKRSGLLSGHTSSLTLTAIYSTANSVDLNDVLLPAQLHTGTKSHSWHASAQFAQYLHESAPGAGDGWGVFFKVGASDGNPNPYQAFFTGG